MMLSQRGTKGFRRRTTRRVILKKYGLSLELNNLAVKGANHPETVHVLDYRRFGQSDRLVKGKFANKSYKWVVKFRFAACSSVSSFDR